MLPPLSAALQLIAWTLLHSVWQLSLAWASNIAMQRLLSRTSASLRLRVASTLFIAGAAVVAFTACLLFSGATSLKMPGITNGLFDLLQLSRPSAWQSEMIKTLRFVSPVVVAGWTIGGLFAAFRAGQDLRTVDNFRRGLLFNNDQGLPPCWPRLVERMTPGLSIKMADSFFITAPITFGWLRPVVVVPVGFFTSMSPAAVEAILAHELAHIRHRDYGLNLAQSVIDCLFWYHPAVHSLSKQIRLLREQRADEAAVAATAVDRKSYARTLLDLRTYQMGLSTLGIKSSPLGDRLDAILNPRPKARSSFILIQVAAALAVLVSSLSFASQSIPERVAFSTAITTSFSAPLPAQIYDIMGVRRPNVGFARAVEAAVIAMRKDRFDHDAAIALSEVVSNGGRPDELMRLAFPAFSAANLKAKPIDGWVGGNNRDWDVIARRLIEYAKSAKTSEERARFAKTSLLIAGQDRIVNGGFVQRFLRDPDCMNLLPASEEQKRRLMLAVSAEAKTSAIIATMVTVWSDTAPSSVPSQIAAAAADRYAFQWHVAYSIYCARKTDEARAEKLMASARASGKLGYCLALLGRR